MLSLAALAAALCGCGFPPPSPPDPPTDPDDPTNGGAAYLGSATCQSCHAGIGEDFAHHGHGYMLQAVEGLPPMYPAEAPDAGIAAPPPGYTWEDIAYAIGGYRKAAAFTDLAGALLTDGSGNPLIYDQHIPANGVAAGYRGLTAAEVGTTGYDHTCFRCHTTGPLSLTENGGQRQGNRPEIGGTWAFDGVGCESCHGPGGFHVPNPSASNIQMDPDADSCARCHAGADNDPATVEAANGYILGGQQTSEVDASPHASFTCTICHNTHVSIDAPDGAGLRNTCTDCHAGMTMALHGGRVYVQDDYVEPLSCQSCHMPYATRYASNADAAFTAPVAGRVGDTRSHLMWIDSSPQDYHAMFTPDGSGLALQVDGHAAVTLDFVCQRCHHAQGNAFVLRLEAISSLAERIHDFP